LVAEAARHGFSVVSGGARGIDAAVHRSALALEAPQVAFVPCFQDDPYPPEHSELFGRIESTEGCGVVYARPPDATPSRGLFLSRNRVLVGSAVAVVVVEAGLRSGSMSTGCMALELGRRVLAVRGSPGTAALIERGARGLDPRGADSVTMAGGFGRWLIGEVEPEPQWPSALADAAAGLKGRRYLTVDDFEDPVQGTLALVDAEASGQVVEASPGRYVLCE
jgi:DNA processing protein